MPTPHPQITYWIDPPCCHPEELEEPAAAVVETVALVASALMSVGELAAPAMCEDGESAAALEI